MNRTPVAEFLDLETPLIDVRSPGEFLEGHITSAFNIPLLNDDHRAKVGTTYKQKGREAAIELGHRLVDPIRNELLESLSRLDTGKNIRVYCARGGLRSMNMASFFEENGYRVTVLSGGYKAYRNHILKSIAAYRKIIILSGYTGSGKTEILRALSDIGSQVLDLEGLACHKGSAFGSLGYEEQPKSAVFHNRIFDVLKTFDPEKPLWVENESHTIGKVFLPPELWENMKVAEGVELVIPESERVQFILGTYGTFPAADLKACVVNLSRRLGDEDTRLMGELIDAGELEPVVSRLFRYYDKAYEHGRVKRNCHTYVRLSFDKLDPHGIARELQKLEHTFYNGLN